MSGCGGVAGMKTRFLLALCVVCGLALGLYGVLAYFVIQPDRAHGVMRDGLGRLLYEPAGLASLLHLVIPAWPGWGWFLTDLLIWMVGSVIIKSLWDAAHHQRR
jgi:hypothetical protein